MREIKIRKFILFLSDIFFLFSSLYLILLIRFNKVLSFEEYKIFSQSFFPLFLLWIFFLFILDFYSLKLRIGELKFFHHLSIFFFLSLSSGVLYFYFQPHLPIRPRTILVFLISFFLVFFLLWRWFFEFLFKYRKKKENIYFLGDNFSETEELISEIKKQHLPYNIIGKSQNLKDLEKALKKETIKELILSRPLRDFRKSPFLQKISFESFGSFYERITQKEAFSALVDPIFLEDFYKKDDNSYLISKRIFDLFFSFIGTLFFLLLLPFIALGIKIDSPGPVFIIQKRIGKDGKIFHSIKFRSLIFKEEEPKALSEIWREKDKKEITRVGRFLRFTHLDEIPQFLNILKGEMSLVGPRPELERLGRVFEKEIPFYFLRYYVKPGFTGWGQINFPPSRSLEEAREKFQYDLYYLKHRSFLFDIIIFLKSLRKFLS